MGEGTQVGVLVRNLFLRVPVEAAVKAAGLRPVALAGVGEAVSSQCQVVIVDLEATGDDPTEAVQSLVAAAKTVLAFGPHVRGEMLGAVRAAGAVVLPRSVFIDRLPDLLRAATSKAGES